MNRFSDATTWNALTFGAAAGASLLTRAVLKRGWSAVAGKKPPLNPAAPETAWSEALLWTVASSLVAGVARLLARRQATRLKRGHAPSL